MKILILVYKNIFNVLLRLRFIEKSQCFQCIIWFCIMLQHPTNLKVKYSLAIENLNISGFSEILLVTIRMGTRKTVIKKYMLYRYITRNTLCMRRKRKYSQIPFWLQALLGRLSIDRRICIRPFLIVPSSLPSYHPVSHLWYQRVFRYILIILQGNFYAS